MIDLLPIVSACARSLLGALLAGAFLAGCVTSRPAGSSPQVYRDAHIASDTIWSGQILVDGTVKLAKGATLTIQPGTEVAFVRRDQDADGLGDGSLVVEGRLLALGTREQPIRFLSAAEVPRPGDWLEIRVDFAREVHLRYCEIRDSAYTLHAHFTRGVVEDCTIRYNIDGCRLGQADFTFRYNLIEHNEGKGINFRNSTVDIHHNIVRYNGSGVFLFETDRSLSVTRNNFYGNLDNFRLGDFFTGAVALQDNWWGIADRQAARQTIYDQAKDPAIGKVTIAPRPTWVPDTGPRDALHLEPLWAFATDGYVDAGLVAGRTLSYAASWDGRVYALNAAGDLQWSRQLGDIIDATPLLDDDLLVLQTWSREIYALNALDGEIRWRFDYSPSRADDHRQGSATAAGQLVLVPTWNGSLLALDRLTGERQWTFAAEQPLRSRPVWDGRQIYLASGSGRLSALTPAGMPLWTHTFAAPLLAAPVLLPEGVAVLSRDGELAAFAADGSELWRRPLAEPCYYGTPVYHDRSLYVPTAAGALWKIEASSGRVLWREPTAGPVYAPPLLAAGRVYVGDNSGVLQVFGADSGRTVARYQVLREIQSRPLWWQNRLLFGSRDHQVHALEPRARPDVRP